MRDSTTHRRTATTHTGCASNARTRRLLKLTLVAQAAATLILAVYGGDGDDASTLAGGKLDTNDLQQQGNANTGSMNVPAPAINTTAPPIELPDYIKPVNYKLWFRPSIDLNSLSGHVDTEIKVTR